MYLKSKFTVNTKTLENNKNNISIPTKETRVLYGDNRTYIKDIDNLIECGFIRQITSGVPTMSVSIYGFSEQWKYFGTDEFKISEKDKRYKREHKKVHS